MSNREPQWPASLTLLVGIGLQLVFPHDLEVAGLFWGLPLIEAAAALALTARFPDRMDHTGRSRQVLRTISITLIGLMTATNLLEMYLLLRQLVGGQGMDGPDLVRAAVAIWSTNVIAFACWYWELDGGGPVCRQDQTDPTRDFMFPQMDDDVSAFVPIGWHPRFGDYLYLAFTNATAFSPTDTMPLSLRAKALMAVQSLAALVTIAIIAARAVNILH
jgi:hypothetical protein